MIESDPNPWVMLAIVTVMIIALGIAIWKLDK